jgi:hypothetical protein
LIETLLGCEWFPFYENSSAFLFGRDAFVASTITSTMVYPKSRSRRRIRMSASKAAWVVTGVVIGFASGAATLAIAEATSKDVIATLDNNQGILVDMQNFNVVKGSSATGDPLKAMAKMNPHEVSSAAIVFRQNGKLYMVDGTPPANASPQAMKDFQSNWNVSYMKNFQDNWNVSYMK